MKNFKEIADKCLAGELSGTFVLRNGKIFYSKTQLSATSLYALPYCIAGWCYSVAGNCYSKSLSIRDNDVINFIPDNMQEQIKIDIPEGKVPIMEQTENGVVITWKEKELTYTELSEKFKHNPEFIHSSSINSTSRTFFKKAEVLRKLINIRNYFGTCDKTKKGYHICHNINIYDHSYEFIVREFCICDPHEVVFAKKEHAEQAIKMLGCELKYLFEPW